MMYHLGKHNQVNSENVSQPFICRECGRLFCDSNSLMRHIIIHQDRLEKLMEEIKGLKNTEFEDRATAVQCPQCAFGCNCPKIFVQHAKTRDNLTHYYFCEECNYITLTQQALEAHLHVAHLNKHQPQRRRVTHTNDAEGEDHVQVQCKMGVFAAGDKVVLERRSEPKQSVCGDSKNFADLSKVARFKPNLFEERARFPHCSSKKGDIYIQMSKDKTINHTLFKRSAGSTKTALLPSLWRIDKHGKLLLQPGEKLDVATDLTCAEQDAENNDSKVFGSTKQENCPAAADFLLSARKLKLDQMFCQESKKNPGSGSLQVQANHNSPSKRKMSTPLHNTTENMNGNILPRLSQRLKKQCAVRELDKGCEGSDNFSDDTSGATGSFLESRKNERNPYARRYFRKRQSFSAKHQSPHTLEDEDDGAEDCSDIEQLVIKEEYIETTVCDDPPQSSAASPGDSCGIFPTPGVEHKTCPYCPAMFESGVGLSNHVRGHLHRVGLSYNARHMVSPEQVALQDCQPRVRRRISAGMRRMRKAVKPETRGEHTCPLCWGWFDTKTGLSNHVRGHLKRIGRSVTSNSSKSPLCVLKELLKDKKEHGNILQVLSESRFPTRPPGSQKLISSNDLFLTAIPVKIQCGTKSPYPILNSFVPKQEADAFSDRKELQVEAQRGAKASSSTLVELLRAKQESVELAMRNSRDTYATRMICDMTKDYMEETQMSSVEANWTHGMESYALGLYAILCLNCILQGDMGGFACFSQLIVLFTVTMSHSIKMQTGLK
uniref:C2H2-type domain-containing protein n=1 Tax=Stegastes partitus TaxID=144197 RepID=A0A3B4ZTV6_9TELE